MCSMKYTGSGSGVGAKAVCSVQYKQCAMGTCEDLAVQIRLILIKFHPQKLLFKNKYSWCIFL